MEFVGNRVSGKSIAATVIVAFFIGRICLFQGNFPAATAFITVMMAVSTVYIYLLPVVIFGMAVKVMNSGIIIGGDVTGLIICGFFLLFFHKKKFTIEQGSGIAALSIVMGNCIFYRADDITYLLSFPHLAGEAIAAVVFVRVINTIAKSVFANRRSVSISRERVEISYIIGAVSLVGAIGFEPVMLCGWIVLSLTISLYGGFGRGGQALLCGGIYWAFSGHMESRIFLVIGGAILVGWFLSTLAEHKYRKIVMALAFIAVLAAMDTGHFYEALIGDTIFFMIPEKAFRHVFNKVEHCIAPNTKTQRELALDNIRAELVRKRAVYDKLSKIYGGAMEKNQIISYQFAGMKRTVDEMLNTIRNPQASMRERSLPLVAVGNASYSFDQISGDSSASFGFGGQYQALIISDGMGKGRPAADESQRVVSTLSKLLSAGFDIDIAIKTVNGILLKTDGQDMFATLDLAVVNRKTGQTKIFKMGAASTFLKHKESVVTLKRAALPAGITTEQSLSYIDCKLKKGDLLVMVSDGVTDCDRSDPECMWLIERLQQIHSRNPETVAELIVNKAAEKYQLRERDDLTVLVASL